MGISLNLLYRWQQAQLVAEVGSVKVARDPEVRTLRAANKRLA
jgi:transposase